MSKHCFIHVYLGAPKMGIVGAAATMLVSRIVKLFIILIYSLFIDKKWKIKLSNLLRFDFTYLLILATT